MILASPDLPATSGRGSGRILPGKPGKTGPRLLHDASRLDIAKPLRNYDILADAAPIYEKGKPLSDTRARGSCDHQYALSLARTKVPEKDYRPAAGDRFWVAAVCRKCRCHVRVETTYSPSSRRPCPNQDFPLHHFLRKNASTGRLYQFECSSPDCRMSLDLHYNTKVVSDKDIALITDRTSLNRRYELALVHGPDRGYIMPTEVATLWKLRRYIRDSLNSSGQVKKIPLENKRYVESFGKDCDDLFERLGFLKEGEGDEAAWVLPRTDPESSDRLRLQLERWDLEVQILIDEFVAKTGDNHPCSDFTWYPADQEMDRLLSAQSYKKVPEMSDPRSATGPEHPYYASLGALRDFADELIIFAYDRQTDCDPQNAPYYFDCLQDLGQGRRSEELIKKTSFLESQGVIGREALNEAYDYLNLDPKTTLSDVQIVDRFRARMTDTSASLQPTARQMLKRVGVARQSRLIMDTASDTLETYAQALSWLGAEDSYPDESILTLHTAKVADNPELADQARKAVQIIAETRNSDPLKSWLSTGEMRDSGMSVDDACAHLKINLKDVDETMLQVVFDNARSDNPGWKTEQAIETVTSAYQKPQPGPQHDPAIWPVGLTSHGNTCYLNSLLQYYFTIKPLRDLVLNFDDYKYDLSKHTGKVERIGARKVTPLEIRAYQKFVYDLKHLFERMIRDRGPAVKPEADLVCRAFLKAEDTEAQTGVSSRGHSPPADIGIEQVPEKPPRPGLGANLPAKSPPNPLQSPGTTTSRAGIVDEDAASSTTLGDTQAERNAFVIECQDVDMHESKPVASIRPLTPPDSPTIPAAIHDTDALDIPPIPPRVASTPVRQQTNLAKAEEAARQQQDVTEVMDEILFRLRCAIVSRGSDIREEQLDAFRDIFYMRISEKTLIDNGKIESKEEDAMNILLNIPSRPTDIYSALDEIFELQSVEYGRKRLRQYKTLQSLPPLLQINIPRNTYDRTTGRGIKVDYKFHLEETLYLDRYFEWEGNEVLDKRRATWEWRQRLEQLQAQRDVINHNTAGIDGPSRLQTVARYIKGLAASNDVLQSLELEPVEVDDNLIADLEAIAEAQKRQLNLIEKEIASLQTRISTSFEGLRQIKYRLHAVFFHRGGYGHGHYWTIIRDLQKDIWRQYNDEKVEEFTKLEDIFDAETWQQGTPTYAVYVKEDEDVYNYVQSTCRDPEPPPEPFGHGQLEMVDEVMQDAPPPPPDYPPPTPHN